MGANNGGVNHGVLVICLSAQGSEDFVPNARSAPAHMPQMHDAEVSEALRQITPRDACAVAKEHSIHKQSVVFGWSANMSRPSGKKVFDLLPLAISQSVSTSHAMYNVAGLLFDDTL